MRKFAVIKLPRLKSTKLRQKSIQGELANSQSMKAGSLRVDALPAGKFSAQSASWTNLSATMVIIILKHYRKREERARAGNPTYPGLLMAIYAQQLHATGYNRPICYNIPFRAFQRESDLRNSSLTLSQTSNQSIVYRSGEQFFLTFLRLTRKSTPFHQHLSSKRWPTLLQAFGRHQA